MIKKKSSKIGLAFSGGGFRASFFHIGVLARMADLGLLRHVEVISTVSGGSIIGALYYLHIKKLLQEKEDCDIKDEDYQEIIKKIEVDFLQAIQKNLRLRTFLNPYKNLKMSLPNYSRSDHIGELYDKYLYQKVVDPNNKSPIEMKDLIIIPRGEKKSFHPNVDNKNRKAKVPILLLNATVLNNGHNWRFNASGMGEANVCISDCRVDKNFKLKKVDSYDKLCNHNNFKLGMAVAASACVPGIFAPLAISNLYDEKVRVQLVDGGVYDNQGINGLLDEKCGNFIISDASKQMEDEKEPEVQLNNVIRRANSILADHIREQELSKILKDYPDSTVLLHLKKGIQPKEITYCNGDHEPENKTKNCETEVAPEFYGVNREVQLLLSRVRTDLDSFSDVEAFSLMYDGYKMIEFELNNRNIKDFITNPTLREKSYHFFKIEEWMSSSTINPYYKSNLEASSQRFFRTMKLKPFLKIVTMLMFISIFIILVSIFGSIFSDWANDYVTKGNLLVIILFTIILFVLRKKLYNSLSRNPVMRFLLSVIPAILISITGFICIGIYLIIFDRLFLYLGSLEVLNKVKKKKAELL
ncbi:patatin-like phospholipase family protein [Priestia aryabhattai]|uniref:patatin-like phospholipase family protein n=1 Tax=Priestia aryabhattai TaxID=412384 RepID=UPI001C8E16BD|nr:patatin-like phospholipase family protein [Priestia aryabhattai]MBY0064465.1 patatin-like phospholipase family protein [Priestia aryabhattai]